MYAPIVNTCRVHTAMISGLVRACHPEPTAAVTVGSCVLAVAMGCTAGSVVVVGATVLASQLAVGWMNDWLDADRDRAVGRRDKPVVSGAVSRRAVGIGAIVAAILVPVLGLLNGRQAAAVITLGLISGLLYNWPLKFTLASVVPYVVSFASLAAFVALSRPGSPAPPWWLVAAGACLGGGAHFVNVLPDLADDDRTGVHGLPHRIGRTASVWVSAVLLLAATGLLAFAPSGFSWPSTATVLVATGILAVGLIRARRPGSRAAFRAVLVVAVIDVALLMITGARG
jgi:4-hydroxybenzoate polyprenyltransferase